MTEVPLQIPSQSRKDEDSQQLPLAPTTAGPLHSPLQSTCESKFPSHVLTAHTAFVLLVLSLASTLGTHSPHTSQLLSEVRSSGLHVAGAGAELVNMITFEGQCSERAPSILAFMRPNHDTSTRGLVQLDLDLLP